MKLRKSLMRIVGAWKRITRKVAPTIYLEEIDAHFEKVFDVKNDSEHRVWHEIISEKVHIDLHLLLPNDSRPFYVVYTTGMSDLPMKFKRPDVTWDYKKTHERAEIFCLLLPDWSIDFERRAPKEELICYWWIFEVIKAAARYPHISGNFIGNGHTLQYTSENKPFADNTLLCSAIFAVFDDSDFEGKYGDDLGYMRTADGAHINLLYIIPLYKEELQFKLDHGAEPLLKRLLGDSVKDFSQITLNSSRKNVCKDEENENIIY
ncbi:MAG: suppressor of fused domain protein [Oscillospiraceae bacterium]|nr:suppressor of fused domain protein [Oscillospiraceae bacterium]